MNTKNVIYYDLLTKLHILYTLLTGVSKTVIPKNYDWSKSQIQKDYKVILVKRGRKIHVWPYQKTWNNWLLS